jgi:hypothetical protein
MAKERITEEELVTRIRGEVTNSLGYMGDTISKQREQAMDYYYALPFGNEVEGRSQFVDSTVSDTIEWIKPSLMRVFASGDEMVKFNPVGPEDVPAAKQATDYVNYIFMRDNPGWEIMYSWFTDALLSKNGIVKVWWDETDEWDREEYKGLTEIEFESLVSRTDVEVIEHTVVEEDGVEEQMTEEMQEPVVLHDVVITRNAGKGKVVIENVPPSEFLISRESKNIQDARFVCHRVKKTLSELKEMYPDEDVDPETLGSGGGDDSMMAFSAERLARYRYDNSASNFSGWGDADVADEEGLRTYWLHECYLKTDYDGDGITELRKLCVVGDKVLENDEVDFIPFISLTPIKIPHKFFGLSIADLVMDLQLIKSTLLRNLMDNMYNQNFGRFTVLEGQANLDDLLTQRPGGIVRVKSPGAVQRLDTPTLEPYSFQMLEYLDGVRESRAGISKHSQGLDENALKSHTTATAVAQVMSAAQQRVELIARNFAETGVKELMRVIYTLVQKNQDKQRVILLRNEWVPVRPDMWRDKMDCTISVGLGNGNRDQQLMHLSAILSFAGQAMQGGMNVVNEQNMYNIMAAMVKNMGFQNVGDFLTDPTQVPPEPSSEQKAEEMEQKIKQGELQIKAAEVQIKQQRLQLDAAKLQADTAMKVAEIKLETEQKRPVGIG